MAITNLGYVLGKHLGTGFVIDEVNEKINVAAGVPIFNVTNLNSNVGTPIDGVWDINKTPFGVMKFSGLKRNGYTTGTVPVGYPLENNGDSYADGIGFFVRTGGDFIQVVIIDDTWYWRNNDGAFATFGAEYKDSYASEWTAWKKLNGGVASSTGVNYTAGNGIAISDANVISSTTVRYTDISVNVRRVVEDSATMRARDTYEGSKVMKTKTRFRIRVGCNHACDIKKLNVSFTTNNSKAVITGVEVLPPAQNVPTGSLITTNKVGLPAQDLMANLPVELDVLVTVDVSGLSVGTEFELQPTIDNDLDISKTANDGYTGRLVHVATAAVINVVEG